VIKAEEALHAKVKSMTQSEIKDRKKQWFGDIYLEVSSSRWPDDISRMSNAIADAAIDITRGGKGYIRCRDRYGALGDKVQRYNSQLHKMLGFVMGHSDLNQVRSELQARKEELQGLQNSATRSKNAYKAGLKAYCRKYNLGRVGGEYTDLVQTDARIAGQHTPAHIAKMTEEGKKIYKQLKTVLQELKEGNFSFQQGDVKEIERELQVLLDLLESEIG
jgi:hypothetical protein